MADETDTAAPEPDDPAIMDQQQVETDGPETIPAPGTEPDDPEASAEAEDEDTGADPQDGLDELDFGFKKYRVDPELKKAVEAMRSDATQKHQDAAARQKALDERETALKQQAEADEAEMNDRAALIGLRNQIAQYEKVDWNALEDQDPLLAQKHWRQYQMLLGQEQQTRTRVENAASQKSQKAQQSLAKRIEETREFVKTLPGWGPDRATKIEKFASEQGIPEDFVRSNFGPLMMKMLYFAQIGHELVNKQPTAKPKPQTPAAPLKTVAGKSSPGATRSLADAAKSGNIEEYKRLRDAGRSR